MDCSDYKAVIDAIYVYVLPFVTLLGLVGNALTSVLFLATKLKSKSSSIYLGALSVTDLAFLLTLVVTLLNYNDYFDVYNVNVFCQVTLYVSTVCSNLSVWLIVAFTTERFIAVKHPLKRATVCTVRRAKRIIVYLILFTCVSHLYLFWCAGIVTDVDGMRICEMKMEYEKFMEVVHYLDTVFVLLVPFCVIVTLNISIARAILVSRQNVFLNQCDDEFSSSASFHSSGKLSNDNERANTRINSGLSNQSFQLCTVLYARRIQMAKCQRNITKIFLLTSTVFLILNVPSYTIRLILFTYDSMQWKPETDRLCFYQHLATCLYYTNFSVNFLLYSMCGSTFRKALLAFLLSGIRKIRPARANRNNVNQSWKFSVYFGK